jgi:hypothetical protein
MTPEERIICNVTKAEEKFWDTIGELFPEVKSGDFPFDWAIELHFEMLGAVKAWLKWNNPSVVMDFDKAGVKGINKDMLNRAQPEVDLLDK